MGLTEVMLHFLFLTMIITTCCEWVCPYAEERAQPQGGGVTPHPQHHPSKGRGQTLIFDFRLPSTKPGYWELPKWFHFQVRLSWRAWKALEPPERPGGVASWRQESDRRLQGKVKVCQFDNITCRTPRKPENYSWMLVPYPPLNVKRT